MINTHGKPITPFDFDEIKRQFNGVIAAKKFNKWAIFNNLGKQLTDFKYDELTLLDLDENTVRDFGVNRIQLSAPKQALIRLNNKWGITDMEGNEIYPPIYSYFEMYQKLKPNSY